MFYDAPGLRLSALGLRLASADDLSLLGRKRVVGIDRSFRFDEHAVFLFGERD
jgi:hypothetical protein